MDDDVIKEDYVRIDYNLQIKEALSTSNPTTISSTPTQTSIEEFLKKDEENEKDSTINPMVNVSSNPNKLVMSPNSIIDNSYIDFTNSCALFTNSKLWTLYFDISRNEYGAND